MSLRRQRTQGHGRRVEAREDILHWLHLGQINRLDILAEPKKVPKRGHRALVYQPGVLHVLPVITTGHGFLELTHYIRVESVVLLTVDILQQATLGDGLAMLPGHRRQLFLILLEIKETGALDTAGNTFETQIHHIICQANRLK